MALETSNIMEHLPKGSADEVFEVLARGQDVKIERIISKGHTSPEEGWYDQDQAEWVMVIDGAAELTFEPDQTRRLNKGDHILIPPHQKHKVSWTDPTKETVWLAVFFSPNSHPI